MKRLHLICNAHLDPVWQWTRDEGISAAIATFKSAADLCDEFDYVFCHNEALLYEAIENYAPELFERIRLLVKAGKWKIIGGWYIQPDCNMPSGESFVRQIYFGKKYFKEKFGVEPEIAANFDSFGHSLGLVQILKKSGYKGYLLTRSGSDIQCPGRFFSWNAPDGSDIIVGRVFSYESKMGRATEKINYCLKDAEDVDFVLWGVGNHGGGPSRKDLKDISELKSENTEILHSYPEKLFEDNILVSGEISRSLGPCMPGCYTSMMKIKQAHRRCENLLYSTEKILSSAIAAGMNVNLTDFENSQKQFLLSEFHDILPGSSVPDGEREGLMLLSSAENTFSEYRMKAFFYLTMGEKPAEDGEYPVYVYNFMPYELVCPVEVEFSLADQNWSEEFVFEPEVYCGDERITSQQIKENSTLNLDWRKRIIFIGKLKPMGVTRFKVRTVKKNKASIDADSGSFILPVEPSVLRMYDDTADPWGMSEKESKSLGENPVNFNIVDDITAKKFFAADNMTPQHITESGPIYTGFEQLFECQNSKGVIEYRIYKNLPFYDLKVTVEFNDKNKLVRLFVPLPKGISIGDGPYIVEEKGDTEIVFREWAGKKNGDKVFAVINDGIHGGKFVDGGIELTLLRGSGYLFHPIGERKLYPDDRYMPRIDNGRYVFNFRVVSGSVDEVVNLAAQFNQPPYAVNVFPIGSGEKNSVIYTDSEVYMPVCRTDNNGRLIMRFYNPDSGEKSFNIYVGSEKAAIKCYPYEIVSAVKEPDGKINIFRDEILM